jgi:hypothetical protein
MARSVTLGEIRQRARDRADKQGDHIDDAEWTRLIDASYCELYELLASSGLNYFEATQSITTDGTATVDCPDDYFQTIGIDRGDGSDGIELDPIDVRQRHKYGSGHEALAYRIVNNTITFYPTPSTGRTYTHLYIPAAASLVDADDDTEIDGVSGWEELIVVQVAIKALHKEESDTSALERAEQKLLARITEMADLRQASIPRRIVDVRTADDDDLIGRTVPPGWGE